MARRPRALVVDDDESLAQIVALMLRAAGFEVETAHNGIDGYWTYRRNPTDWVVSDIQMPELNGLGMMRWIRSHNPRVKTIYMSGEVEKFKTALTQETQEFGAKVLLKPFSKENLMKHIFTAPETDSRGA